MNYKSDFSTKSLVHILKNIQRYIYIFLYDVYLSINYILNLFTKVVVPFLHSATPYSSLQHNISLKNCTCTCSCVFLLILICCKFWIKQKCWRRAKQGAFKKPTRPHLGHTPLGNSAVHLRVNSFAPVCQPLRRSTAFVPFALLTLHSFRPRWVS